MICERASALSAPSGCVAEIAFRNSIVCLVHEPSAAVAPSVMVRAKSCNLVDPASSHMLVSKIKPCMSKYKLLYGETANGSLKQLSSP